MQFGVGEVRQHLNNASVKLKDTRHSRRQMGNGCFTHSFDIVPEVLRKVQIFPTFDTMLSMVTVYTTPTCAFCYTLKEYLHDKKIQFTEKDLTQDQEAQKWVIENTGQLAVPVIDIDGSVVIGFDRPKIEALLREKKLLK